MNIALLLILADAVLVLHTALALFLACGLALIWLGGWLGWGFVRNRRFRMLHLLLMAVVALESVLGIACPLTEVESALRMAARLGKVAALCQGGFIAHWLSTILYYDLDERVFLALYLAALGLTLLAWRVVGPRGKATRRRKATHKGKG